MTAAEGFEGMAKGITARYKTAGVSMVLFGVALPVFRWCYSESLYRCSDVFVGPHHLSRFISI